MSAGPCSEEERAANTVPAVYIASVLKVILNDLMIESIRAVNPTRVGRRDGRVSLVMLPFLSLFGIAALDGVSQIRFAYFG